MQLADAVVPVSVHVPVNMPAPLLVKDTEPVGVDVGAGDVSVTVAVHDAVWPTTTVDGVHETVVVVVRSEVKVTLVFPLLPE